MDVRLTSSSEVVTGLAHHGLALDGSAAFRAAPVNDIASLTMDPVRVAGGVKQLTGDLAALPSVRHGSEGQCCQSATQNCATGLINN